MSSTDSEPRIRKPSHTELVRETAPYLSSYFDAAPSFDHVVQNLDPRINIEDLTELLEYYFLLTGRVVSEDTTSRDSLSLTTAETGGFEDINGVPVGVCDFVSFLPSRLRTVESAIKDKSIVEKGGLSGRIDWAQTVKHRSSVGDVQGETFVTRVPERTVQTTENRVLLKFLVSMRDIINRLEQSVDAATNIDDLAWAEEWHSEGLLQKNLMEALNNPNLRQLTQADISVTNRELREVRSDREPLYREAATLLTGLRRLRQGITEQQAKDLLSLDVFAPSDDRTSDLFELYWIFKILDHFEDHEFKQIRGKRGELIASWEADEYEYLLFNDWDGKYRWSDNRGYKDYVQIQLQWPTVSSTDRDDRIVQFLNRRQAIREQEQKLVKQLFGEDLGQSGGRKRPDIVILKLDRETTPPQLDRLFIGEVKHSTVSSRVKDGLHELLEYGAHALTGPHITVSPDNQQFVTTDPNPVAAENISLGLFIGHKDLIKGAPPSGIQVRGYDDDPAHPFDE